MQFNITLDSTCLKEHEDLVFHVTIKPSSLKEGFFSMFKKSNPEHELHFTIENINISDGIQVDKNEILKVSLKDSKEVKFKDGDSAFDVDLAVKFYHDAIKHLGGVNQFCITFDLKGKDQNRTEFVSEKGKISVDVIQVKPSVEAYIDLDEDEFTLEDNGIKKIGCFNLFYNSIDDNPLFQQPNIDFEVLLSLKNEKDENISGLLWEQNGNLVSDKFKALDLSPKPVDINGYPKPVQQIPLYIDFSQIKGINKERTALAITMVHGRFCNSYEKEKKYNFPVDDAEFSLIKNIIPSSIGIYLKELISDTPVCMTETTYYHLEKRDFAPGSTLITPVELSICNCANEAIKPYAGLCVFDINISESGTSDLFLRGKNGNQIFNVISCKNSACETINQDGHVFLPDGTDEKITLRLEFNPTGIDSIGVKKFDFEILSTIDISYCENSEGLPLIKLKDNLQKKTITLVWHLHMLPHAEWLCIDYGSSAIVCKYDKSLIDLKTKKEDIFRKNLELSKFRKDELEAGTKFLNSDILLYDSLSNSKQSMPVSSLCSEQEEPTLAPYSSQAVFLAPTSDLLRDRFLTQLPCLKILVGNDTLPEDPQYETFSYYHKDSNGQIVKESARNVKDKRQSLLSVNTIFAESYHILFRYFVAGAVNNVSNVNKLALSYPNTYTPYHRSILQQVVNKVFPSLRTLMFISESDSVAAYYMEHWKEYHTEIKKLKDPEGERVLVFDMGAGTLDITYFKQKWNSTRCYHKVEVLGKLGTGKAGNYLDFVIASIVCRLTGIPQEIASVDYKGDGDTYSQRVYLKQVIKTQIKPKLSASTGQMITFSLQKEGGKRYTVNTSDILKDQEFIDCLNECTYGIIDKLRKYLGKRRPLIETVIMSGRSCKLVPLQRKLQEAVEQNKRDHQNEIDFITLDAPINVKNDSREDRQKTVVVEGAEIIAREFASEESRVRFVNKRLYASYGISYINQQGDLDYTELLNHQDTEDECLPGTDFCTEPKEIPISKNSSIQLIQSYMDAEDTITSLREGNREFVSQMENFETQEIGNSVLKVSLRIDKLDNVTLIMNNCQSAGMPPKGVDLQNPITKKSLWPLVFTSL